MEVNDDVNKSFCFLVVFEWFGVVGSFCCFFFFGGFGCFFGGLFGLVGEDGD